MAAKRAREAIERARELLQAYYHPACEATTEVNDRVIIQAALDPWRFPATVTDCVGCGAAPMKEVVLHNKQTLHDAFMEMRRSVPSLGKFMRFLGIPLFVGVIGASLGFAIPTDDPRLAAVLICFMFGVLLGLGLAKHVFKELRRLGLFW